MTEPGRIVLVAPTGLELLPTVTVALVGVAALAGCRVLPPPARGRPAVEPRTAAVAAPVREDVPA
ncbi:hypothetical protein, partial [Frankia sp. CcWB2]